jgi:hypothetical protein
VPGVSLTCSARIVRPQVGLWLDYGGGIHDTLAKAVANFPVQFFCSLDNQHVGRAGDVGIHREARLHLDDLA